jgi:hypothetical protein
MPVESSEMSRRPASKCYIIKAIKNLSRFNYRTINSYQQYYVQ